MSEYNTIYQIIDNCKLSSRVCEKAKSVLSKININYFNTYEYDIRSTPYGTLLIDWFDDKNELSLEIGKDSLGYYCDSKYLKKAVDSIDITTNDEILYAVKEVEKDINITFNKIMEENIEVEEITIEEKLEQSEDKYLRLFAEFENYKKRVKKEKEDLVLSTKTKVLSSVLDIDGDISLAIKSMSVVDDGLLLIAQKLENYLKSQGIEAIPTDVYDEELHEVISVIEIGEEKIIDVVSKGYTLEGKPFRYPKIVLGK